MEKNRISELPEGMIIWKNGNILGITKATLPDEYYDYYCIKTPGNDFDYEIKDKNKYKTKYTTISGYCGKNYEENLRQFRKELKKKGGHIDGIATIKSIVIYSEKVEEE
jgi:hypothetical protein